MNAPAINSNQLESLAKIKHVALDMDGTIYRGGILFEATLPFLAKLREMGIGFSFLTNNTSLSKADYLLKLKKLGIDAQLDEMNTPVDATMAWLRSELPEVKKIVVLGTESLCREFEEAGWEIDWENPGAVVVGFDTSLDYQRLCKTTYWVQQGLPFIATHPDWVCPTDLPTVLVDCGAICACITAATGRKPIVLGKPEPTMLLELSSRHGIAVEEMAMVGDRLYTDIVMAHRANALSVLVLSGEATLQDVDAADQKPDLVVTDVGHLGQLLVQAKAM